MSGIDDLAQHRRDARAIVKSRAGDWHGTYGMVAGPGHRPRDRSLKIWDGQHGVLVHSFAGDDWRVCRAWLDLDDGADWRERRPAAERFASGTGPHPPERVHDILRTAGAVELVQDAVAYLTRRHLWPLPAGCTLKAHVALEYWRRAADGSPRRRGWFPAIIAPVINAAGALVTTHVTYLDGGRKLEPGPARKIMSPTTGRAECCCRLMPADGDTLGIAEGIETALAAHRIHGGTVWAALNAGMLASFEPPPGIARIVIYPDADEAGMRAAWQLRDRLRAIETELRRPPAGCKDWADALAVRHGD